MNNKNHGKQEEHPNPKMKIKKEMKKTRIHKIMRKKENYSIRVLVLLLCFSTC